MTIAYRFLVLLLSGLLLAATSCQRASYSFQPPPTSAAGPAIQPPHQPVAQPGGERPVLARPPARVSPRVALQQLRQLRRQLAQVSLRRAVPGTATIRTQVPALSALHRRAPAASRALRHPTTPTADSDMLATIIVGVVGLVGALLLIFGVGSGLAVVAGTLVLLLAAAIVVVMLILMDL